MRGKISDTMAAKIILRNYNSGDCDKLAELFARTVRTVNAADYTKEQLEAWAAGCDDRKKWDESLKNHYTVVAEVDGNIAGFGDIGADGYLDRLYVHADYQRRGIASAICDELESFADSAITTHSSITAKPFFEKRGYVAVKEQQVERRGVLLKNFVMIKSK